MSIVPLLAFPGIGPKVADCVLLYGFHKLEAFPVDVWIARVMRKHYFRNRRVSEAKIHAFARKKWAKNAGYLQQYFFHTARMGMYTSP
jgi:N-glycosylase/DNA lyase